MMAKLLKPGLALPFACIFAIGLAASPQQRPADAAQAKPADAPLPPAQAIIDRHIEAVGGRAAIKSHNSVKISGSISVPASGMSGTLEAFAARPNKTRSNMTLAGIGDLSEGFDGKVAWSISPMTGPMLASGEELAQKAFEAEFDGALGISTRYDSIRTVEKTTFEERPVYKIVLSRKGAPDEIAFYDVETGLKAGSIVERKSPMGTVAVTSALSDYKKFGDLLHPTMMKQTMTGVQMVSTFTSIEYDKVDPSVFELPAPIKALVK
ncbi:MAG TPA: hypothetical protein VJ813_11830 [Vicinamibacterales bacterium]|nr:hypothetical protein [Vicinamibacterales bacterium]